MKFKYIYKVVSVLHSHPIYILRTKFAQNKNDMAYAW